jgi:uncharacterized protein YbjT (DUF2867 family)
MAVSKVTSTTCAPRSFTSNWPREKGPAFVGGAKLSCSADGKRLICVTGFGAAAFHLLLGRVYDDKDVQERIVRRSKLDWVIVRPVILTNGPKTNTYRALVDPRGWTCGFISRADVADFLVKQIDDASFLHKTPVLTS